MTTNADREMFWINAWNDLIDIVKDLSVKCLLPDGQIVDFEQCKGWLQESAYSGYIPAVSAGSVLGRPGVIASRRLDIPENDRALPHGYFDEWIRHGIVTRVDIRRDGRELAKGEDPYPEHYRWRAFSRFLAAQQTLSPLLARQLYALGSADVDLAMGGSMMAEVLRHRDCPLDLLNFALTSERPHLQRIAEQRLCHSDEAPGAAAADHAT